ncbi:MAG: efflux RND transporter permease subunit [Spirochaetales bacterium]|nr:efflux RND transporter permease subunit [Spirochaetales bacterium]
MKQVVRFFLKRKIFTLMLITSVLIVSIISIFHIKLELISAVPSSTLMVNITWQDVSPETIEREVVSIIESLAATIRGSGDISSTSNRGEGQVIISLIPGTNPDSARFSLKDKIRSIQLPDRCFLSISTADSSYFRWEQDPLELLISKYSSKDSNKILVRVTSADSKALMDQVNGEIRSTLLSIPGVSTVEIAGQFSEGLFITTDPEKSASYGINSMDIASLLNVYSPEFSQIGFVSDSNRDYPLFVNNPSLTFKNIDQLSFTARSGTLINLSDFSETTFKDIPPENRARINGLPAIVVSIKKTEEANLLQFSKEIKQSLTALSEGLGDVIQFEILMNPGDELAAILIDMGIRLLLSVLAVFLVLFMFLKKITPAFLVLATLGFTLLLTITGLYFLGMSINIITIIAMILAAGMLVDNTLVIFENIREETALDSVADKTGHILSVIFASSLTNIIVLLPFIFLSGTLRAVMLPFAITTFLAMTFSIFVSASFTPSMYYHFLAGKTDPGTYRKLPFSIISLLGKKHLIVPAGLITFSCLFLFAPKVLSTGSYEREPTRDRVSLSIRMLSDTRIEETEEIVKKFEDSALNIIANSPLQLITNVSRKNAYLMLAPRKEVEVDLNILTSIQTAWRGLMGNYVSVGFFLDGPLGYDYTSNGSSAGMYDSEQGIRFECYDYDSLKKHAIAFSHHLKRIPFLYKIKNGFEREKRILFGPSFPGYDLVLDTNQSAKLDISRWEVEGVLTPYTISPLSGTTSINSVPVPFSISPPEDTAFFQMNEILKLPVSDSGYLLEEIAELKPLNSSLSIERENQRYIHYVTYKVKGSHYMETDSQIKGLLENYPFPAGFNVTLSNDLYGYEENKIKKSTFIIFLISALLVFMVLAGHFESFTKPILVFLSIPLAVLAVLMGLLVLKEGIGLGSILGLIILAGLAVNDAILFINTADSAGEPSKRLRIHQSGGKLFSRIFASRFSSLDPVVDNAIKLRLRPILITSLTTAAALIPGLFVNTGGDALMGMWKEFSRVVILGLTGSTLMTIVFIPLCYSYFKTLRRK